VTKTEDVSLELSLSFQIEMRLSGPCEFDPHRSHNYEAIPPLTPQGEEPMKKKRRR